MLFQKNQVPHNKKWTKETILALAALYPKRSEFKKASGSAYVAARKMGILDEVCAHMAKDFRFGMTPHNKKWTKEKVLEEASRYATRTEWKNGSPGSYDAAKENGWIDEAMVDKPRMYTTVVWTKESILEEIKKYKTYREWVIANPSSYNAAGRLGIKEEIKAILPRLAGTSQPELDILSLVKNFFSKAHSTVFSNKGGKPSRYELDIYVPELRKGIEFNGTYWHSPVGLKRGRPTWSDQEIENYHEKKSEFFKNKNIEILNIKESEWKSDRESQVDKILSFLGVI